MCAFGASAAAQGLVRVCVFSRMDGTSGFRFGCGRMHAKRLQAERSASDQNGHGVLMRMGEMGMSKGLIGS